MKTKEEIQQHLDETVNTLLGQHRGRIDVVDIIEVDSLRAVRTTMSGGCRGCAGAKATMNSIVTNHVRSFDPTVSAVLDITDHSDKTNAFFKE